MSDSEEDKIHVSKDLNEEDIRMENDEMEVQNNVVNNVDQETQPPEMDFEQEKQTNNKEEKEENNSEMEEMKIKMEELENELQKWKQATALEKMNLKAVEEEKSKLQEKLAALEKEIGVLKKNHEEEIAQERQVNSLLVHENKILLGNSKIVETPAFFGNEFQDYLKNEIQSLVKLNETQLELISNFSKRNDSFENLIQLKDSTILQLRSDIELRDKTLEQAQNTYLKLLNENSNQTKVYQNELLSKMLNFSQQQVHLADSVNVLATHKAELLRAINDLTVHREKLLLNEIPTTASKSNENMMLQEVSKPLSTSVSFGKNIVQHLSHALSYPTAAPITSNLNVPVESSQATQFDLESRNLSELAQVVPTVVANESPPTEKKLTKKSKLNSKKKLDSVVETENLVNDIPLVEAVNDLSKSEKTNAVSNTNEPLHFGFTGLTDAEKDGFSKLASLGGTFVPDSPDDNSCIINCTHLICDEHIKRTTKSITAYLLGKWLVPSTWAEASLKAGKFLDEAQFGGKRLLESPLLGKTIALMPSFKPKDGEDDKYYKLVSEVLHVCGKAKIVDVPDEKVSKQKPFLNSADYILYKLRDGETASKNPTNGSVWWGELKDLLVDIMWKNETVGL